MKRVGQTDKRR